MTEADRWRLCKHPETKPIRRPDALPVCPGNVLRWVITPRMANKPTIRRCTTCGQVGEAAENGETSVTPRRNPANA